MERIFQRYASRRSLFYDLNYASPSRHLIRRLTLGNAAGIFKDNLVPFGANAKGICPKRSNTSCPPSPQGEGICSRYFVRKRILSATALRLSGAVLLSQCLLILLLQRLIVGQKNRPLHKKQLRRTTSRYKTTFGCDKRF